MWTSTWTPNVLQALSNQTIAYFMSLQIRLTNLRQPAETQDASIWRSFRFSARAVYCLLRGQAPRSYFSHPALPGGVEVTASAEDLTLQQATLAPPSDDESHALSLGSGSCRELPSMCWGGRTTPTCSSCARGSKKHGGQRGLLILSRLRTRRFGAPS